MHICSFFRHQLAFTLLLLMGLGLEAQESSRIYLSGTDKDHTRTWEFMCTGGAHSGVWSTIEVPSCWELQGYGTYNYGHDRPHADEQGFYRYRFQKPTLRQGQRVYLVFEGAMTDAEVHLNGRLAGPSHGGAFYPFRYDVTDLLCRGTNLLEVTVSKESANESINRAERQSDYWIFGGLFRPVYLLVTPRQHIDRVAIDARADGAFRMNIAWQTHGSSAEHFSTQTDIVDPSSGALLATLHGGSCVEGHVADVCPWSPETPYRYEAVVKLLKGRHVVHVYRQTFGFRTLEFRPKDGFYLNGKRLMFKGVCRHTFWPESGRTSSKELAIDDVNLIKDMNMNAVRMSHYPPDTYFLDVCDSLGVMVIDELAGWQKAYDTDVARGFVRAMVERDVNHPCIVMWSNGNEGGFNAEVRPDYALYDIQHRKVVEPWSVLDGTDTHHYPRYNQVKERLQRGENVYFPTEFLHGLYDGGHGAGLEDYWQLMNEYPTAAGGFFWNLADEGVVRHDRNDSIDCDALHAPDGVVGPHHEKEGSFYTIKDIWSPIQLTVEEGADGEVSITVSNHYLFTNLKECRFECDLVRLVRPLLPEGEERTTVGFPFGRLPSVESYDFSSVAARDSSSKLGSRLSAPSVTVPSPDIAPGKSRTWPLAGWQLGDERPDILYLRAYDPHGRLVNTWDFVLASPSEIACRMVPDAEQRGVAMASPPTALSSVRLTVPGTLSWTSLRDGWWRLDYAYTLDGDYDYAGVTMDYGVSLPDSLRGAMLLADGPYHTWKNRLRGNCFGQYDKAYNNTATGESWEYPEFKGYYSHFYAVRLYSDSRPLTIVSATEGQYLHLFTPQPHVHRCDNVEPPFPSGDISILSCIPAIGNKFAKAAEGGPQGQKSHYDHQPVRGTLYFHLPVAD